MIKSFIKILLSILGITAISYLFSREKILLKKISHDCDKIKLK